MKPYELELHALACEIADVDRLDYADALKRAREELHQVQQYAAVWDAATVAPSAPYLDALYTLAQGTPLTPDQVRNLFRQDQVVRFLWQRAR